MPRYNIDETWSIELSSPESEHLPRLLDLVEQGVDNVGEEDIDREFLHSVAMQFLSGPITERVFLTLCRDLYPVGVLLGIKVDTHPVFKKTGITIEQLWWVDPAYRGNKVAVELIKAFEDWSYRLGCKRCVMSHFIDPVGEKVKKYYEKNGFKLLEQSYVKELK